MWGDFEDSNNIANMLNDGKYKMVQVGRAFAYDYLKRIGVNTCKNSVQLERLFGSARLGIVPNTIATEQQVLNIIKKMAKLNNCNEIGMGEASAYILHILSKTQQKAVTGLCLRSCSRIP